MGESPQPGYPLTNALANGPFHLALQLAIQRKGLSLAQLRTLMDEAGAHVGQSTLSYWQRGLRRPDMPKALEVILALERVLDLQAGTLLALVESNHTSYRS